MKISIITTTINSATTIKDTFNSILSQSYKDIDYIVIDNESTDGTIEIIKEYEKRFDGKMRWISEKDTGIYDAMNKGIKMAKGDVIGCLNSDDAYSSNDILETVAKELGNEDLDCIFADVHFVKRDNINKISRYYSSGIFKPSLFRFGLMPAHPSLYVRRKCYEQYGLYDTSYKIAADFDMMVRLLYKEKIRYKYIKKDFVAMCDGGTSNNGVKSRMIINKEDVIACRKYGLYTNLLFVCCKYFVKIAELKL